VSESESSNADVVCPPEISRVNKAKLADNALNARLPRHFADGRNEDRARGVGFLREGGDQDPPSLKPPLEVSETFGGAKVSDDDQLKKKIENQKKQQKKIL
jgi:hypothetical protein